MASTAAALNWILLVAAVFLVLLSSSMGRQPGPPHHCPDDNAGQKPAEPAHHCRDDNTDEQPAPTPAPAAAPTTTPIPAPSAPPPTTTTPTPAPAPAPAADCYLNCSMQCSPLCQANMSAGVKQCEADYISNGNGCYDSCTTNTCPDKCVKSGCSFESCTCDNTYARSCCDACARGINPTYFSCVNYYNRAVQYCMINCQDDCNKKCTQG